MAYWHASKLIIDRRCNVIKTLLRQSCARCTGRTINMAELITEEQPRIKFSSVRCKDPLMLPSNCPPLAHLAELMAELEAANVIPTLNDGLSAGNCAIAASCIDYEPAYCTASSTNEEWEAPDAAGAGAATAGSSSIFVSRSGKVPGVAVSLADWVLVTAFDEANWSAQYQSASEEARPTSDTPLHVAALAQNARKAYSWAQAPLVAVHGHALAEDTGLELAERLGFPISHEATLFSTPEDLRELKALFAAYPYPQHRVFIRRGHGFFILGSSVEDCRSSFRSLILPHLERMS